MDLRLLGAYLFALLFDVAMPIAAAAYLRLRLGVPWRYFWYGSLIFFLFQMVIRIPAVQVLQVVFAEPLRNSAELQWAWLFGLALTAGLFEEVGRYLGYRYLVFGGSRGQGTGQKAQGTGDKGQGRGDEARGVEVSEGRYPGETWGATRASSVAGDEDRATGSGYSALGARDSALRPQNPMPGTPDSAWRKGIMYGLGHGGLESMLLVGGSVLLALVNALAVLRMEPSTIAALPPDQAEAVRQARAIFESLPWWMPLMGALERLFTVIIQVGFSILVLQVFLRGSVKWLYLAIGAHFLVDMVAVASARSIGTVATEGMIGLFALATLYLILRLRSVPQSHRP